ncbi:EamA family transporter [Pectinatus haikarae]|uniref:Transporter family protein n=1 Tax=Pectinatus haikarae TaxID=349096 RepID=A0ABT9Y9G2_9FIRM|nr:EamA family transporter [Pectinatus haikarae]MDQ0204471.1 transporter family protein [Pectinatus haikarae]
MESWLFYALLSALSAALVSIFGKVGLQGIDSNAATAVRSIIMALFLIGVTALQGSLQHIPDVFADRKALLFICLSGIAGATSWLFYFLALKVGKISQVAPIDKLSVVFSVLLAMLIFQEKISLIHGLGILLIACGGLVLAIF